MDKPVCIFLSSFLLHMVMQIFFPCCQTSPNMTFRFVHIQYLSGGFGKCGINLRETFCYVFMNRTLANPKLFCRLSYCRIILDNIFGNNFSKESPAILVFTLYAGEILYMSCLCQCGSKVFTHILRSFSFYIQKKDYYL